MKTTFSIILAAALLTACGANAQEQVGTRELEAGYASAAQKLRAEVEEKLTHQRVRDGIFDTLRVGHERRARAEGREPAPFRDGVKVIDISTVPPGLRQDPNDLYWRYHSAVRVRFQLLDFDGQVLTDRKPIDVDVPVAARPNGEWIFPEPRSVIAGLTQTFDELALAHAKIDLEIARSKARVKEMEADLARMRAERHNREAAEARRRAKTKADMDRYWAERPALKRRMDAMERKYPPKK